MNDTVYSILFINGCGDIKNKFWEEDNHNESFLLIYLNKRNCNMKLYLIHSGSYNPEIIAGLL